MRRFVFYTIEMLLAVMLAVSCASIGNPSGGPRDEDPPRFLYASPAQGATDANPSKVVLNFDELVALKDAFSKVVVSPPQSQPPRVSSLGRRVTVEFRDTLLPNTTYTVDFGDAIMDNNEGNKLENFFYTFSTGETLDSLMVSGMVLDAHDLKPAQSIYVGLHSNLADSAFRKNRFERVAKTDEKGRFVIGGLAPGQYRIYALDDRDGDLAWSSPDETLAFYDAIISPYSEEAIATDTIFDLKTGEVDTVVQRQRTKFLPNNILLRSYNTGYKQQYITKYERVDSTRINLIFNAAADSMPVAELIVRDQAPVPLSDVSVIERSATNDTITYWLRDPKIVNTDTLRLALQYLRADSVYQMQPVGDTLRLITQRKVAPAPKAKKRGEVDTVPGVPTMALKTLTGKVEVNYPYVMEMPVPTESFDIGMIHLEKKVDSLWVNAERFGPDLIRFDSLNPRRLIVDYPWEYETTYRITVDSLAGKNLYGIFTDDFKNEFTTRKDNEYGSIGLRLQGAPEGPLFVDLLDQQGRVLRSKPVENGAVKFDFLLPAKYDVRVVVDGNGNGKWDPGNFDLGILPDVSYYYPDGIELKQNWSQDLDWDVFGTPVDKMRKEEKKKR